MIIALFSLVFASTGHEEQVRLLASVRWSKEVIQKQSLRGVSARMRGKDIMGIDFRWTNDPGGLWRCQINSRMLEQHQARKESSIYNILASLLPSDSFMHQLSVSCLYVLFPVQPCGSLKASNCILFSEVCTTEYDSSSRTVSSSTFTSY